MFKSSLSILLITFISNCYLFGQKNTIELNIKKAVYEIGTSTITIDLEFINNSSDTAYLIKPQNIFFDQHYDFGVIDYPQLSSYPYTIKIESNKKCTEEEVYRVVSNLMGEKTIDNDQILIINPNDKKIVNDIQIEYNDIEFCNIGKYTVKIFYNLKVEPSTQPMTENDRKNIQMLTAKEYNIETNLFKCSAQKKNKVK